MSDVAYVTSHGAPIPVAKRCVNDVLRDINARLHAAGIEFGEYDFSDMTRMAPDNIWPESARWITCYAVKGGSEGYYVHISALWQATTIKEMPKWSLLGLAKTWTLKSAHQIATETSKLLVDMAW